MRKLDLDTIKHITFFENKTKAHVRDCIINGESIYFLVDKGNIQKALGKGGSNIKRLQSELKKRIKIWEYDEDPKQFVKNLLPQAESLTINGKNVQATIPAAEKGKIIGKNGSNINNMKEMLRRNTDLEDIEIK